MRNMSFSMTTQQVISRRKTVTRRTGWEFLKPGDRLQPVRKGMGLKRGEKVEPIGGLIQVTSVRRERLDRMVAEPAYGFREVELEGFGSDPVKGWPDQFVTFFADTHGCKPEDEITRIEFVYL